MIKLEWHNTSDEDANAHRDAVIVDISRNLEDLDKPGDLIFHHVFIGDSKGRDDCPLVFVWGVEGSDAFHCEYDPKPVWKTLAELDEDKKNGK